MYWLQVTDENTCVGMDTTILQPKDCQFGLFVPSAFSPNDDGKNDIFRGLLFGNIKQYRFLIYNRWGQCLFTTTDPGKGWDGKYNGILQDTGVYVWVCTYQLDGENAKSEKGTVTLIK
jgi:gliding motility-associated-like protein